MSDTTELFRPIGPGELAELAKLHFLKWPPRLSEQPIFYPVTNEKYAEEITVRWNVPQYKSGFVTSFILPKDFIESYEIHCVGCGYHTEWWIPAEDLEKLNSKIIGPIEILSAFFLDNGSIKKDDTRKKSLKEHIENHFKFLNSLENLPIFAKVLVLLNDNNLDISTKDDIDESKLFSPDDFEEQFKILLSKGYRWINLTTAGVYKGDLILAIETPSEDQKWASYFTRVNHSGVYKKISSRKNWEL